MKVKDLSPEVRQIWRVAKVVQGIMGFTMGVELYTWGPLFYEKLAQASDARLGMILMGVLIGTSQALIAFLEVPTGAIGDAIGRKKTVVWSFSFKMLYFIFLVFVPFCNAIPLIMFLGILYCIAHGFAYTFFSGTFTAWCVDSLRERAPNIGYEHLLSRAYTYNFIAQIFGGILGILTYLYHVPFVGFLLASASCVGCIAFCLGEMENERDLQFLEGKRVSLSVITKRIGEIVGIGFQIFRGSSVILTLVLVFASYMFAVNIVDYLWPVYLRSRIALNNQPVYWIGMAVATLLAGALGSHVLNLWTHRWQKNNGTKMHNMALRRWLIGGCLFAAFPILILSWLTAQGKDTFLFFALAILPVQFAYGVIAPCYETLVNNYIPDNHSQERATILSFGSLIRSLMIMLLAIPSGGSSGAKTTIGWAIPAFLLFVFAIIGNFVLKRAQRKTSEENIVKIMPEAAMLTEKE